MAKPRAMLWRLIGESAGHLTSIAAPGRAGMLILMGLALALVCILLVVTNLRVHAQGYDLSRRQSHALAGAAGIDRRRATESAASIWATRCRWRRPPTLAMTLSSGDDYLYTAGAAA